MKAKHLEPLVNAAKAVARRIPRVSFGHVYRTHNTMADSLANMAMDLGECQAYVAQSTSLSSVP